MKIESKKINLLIGRRNLLHKLATAATAFTIIPRFVLGKGYTAPSDKLYIASIGAGGKGKATLPILQKVEKRKSLTSAMWMIAERKDRGQLSQCQILQRLPCDAR